MSTKTRPVEIDLHFDPVWGVSMADKWFCTPPGHNVEFQITNYSASLREGYVERRIYAWRAGV